MYRILSVNQITPNVLGVEAGDGFDIQIFILMSDSRRMRSCACFLFSASNVLLMTILKPKGLLISAQVSYQFAFLLFSDINEQQPCF